MNNDSLIRNSVAKSRR